MKVKLLKKLRKRFFWFKEINRSYWSYYDKKSKKVYYAFIPGMLAVNDILIYELLIKLNMEYYYIGLYDRQQARKEKKYKQSLIKKYEK